MCWNILTNMQNMLNNMQNIQKASQNMPNNEQKKLEYAEYMQEIH